MLKESLPILKFILIVTIAYFGIDFLYQNFYLDHYASPSVFRTDPLTRMYSRHVVSFLSLIGVKAGLNESARNLGCYISVNGVNQVLVIARCNGFPNILLLFSLLLAFPGPTKKKLWYIPMALLILYGCNIVRVGLLAITNDSQYTQYFKYIKLLANVITHISLLVIFLIWLKISLKK